MRRLRLRREAIGDWDGRSAFCLASWSCCIAANVYLYMQLDKVKKDLTAANDAAQSRIDKLEEATSVSTRSNRKTVDELRDQLERARRQANLAAGRGQG